MVGILVDSNVILDVLTEDPRWYAWSSNALAQCANEGPLYINPIIYAEVSIGVATIEEMEEVLPPESFPRLPIPLEAAFWLGKPSCNTERGREPRSRHCLISSSAPTPRWPDCNCSRGIAGGTGPTFLP